MGSKEFEKLIKKAKMEVKPINSSTGNLGDMYDVGEHTVRIFKKQGRQIITCTCQNDSRFCNEPTICIHKLKLINYLSYNTFEERLKKLKEQYHLFVLNKLTIKPELIFNDLQSLEDSIKR
ncbi:MAG: hypothetical protein ACOC56_06635 [Atribacterota bacterium]